MTLRTTVSIVTLVVLAACGAAAQARASLEGVWNGGLAGPVSASATWHFHGSTYDMHGYPSIGEEGSFTVTNVPAADHSHALTIHFTHVRRCGPCDGSSTLTPSDDSERSATLSADGTTLTMNGWTLAHQR